MSEVSKRVQDRRVLTLIHRFLKAGAMEHDALHETVEGVAQGGPLSPLLSNLILDRLDRELERRRHRFVRYATRMIATCTCGANGQDTGC
jgi:retron-type reverse transcriptase